MTASFWARAEPDIEGGDPLTQQRAAEEPTDADLLKQCHEGDDAAFELIYRRHAQHVYAFLLRLSGDHALAVDLRQEAFVKLWRTRERWGGQPSARAFLIHTARALQIDAQRRSIVRARYSDRAGDGVHSAPSQPDEVLRRGELARRVEHAIDQLPPRQREVFTMKRDAGLSYREIGGILKISPKTVEVHMVGALRALRSALGDLRLEP